VKHVIALLLLATAVAVGDDTEPITVQSPSGKITITMLRPDKTPITIKTPSGEVTITFRRPVPPLSLPNYDAIVTARLNDLKSLRVPLPDRTPYDSNRQARAKYLEGYASGYRVSRAGFTLGTGVDPRQSPLEVAYTRGFIDGQHAPGGQVIKQQTK